MAGKKEKMNQRSNRGAQIPHVGNLKPSHTNHTLVALIRIRLALFYFVAFSCCRRVRRSIPALSLRLNKPPWWFDVWCLKSAKFDASLLFWFSEGRQQVFRRSSAGRQQIVSRSSADRQQVVSRSSAGRQKNLFLLKSCQKHPFPLPICQQNPIRLKLYQKIVFLL
jgi:hypothetical protein